MSRHHNEKDRYAALELQHREQIIGGLRGLRLEPLGYREIATLLGISTRKVEAVLGEAAALHATGFSHSEIGRRIGLPRTTVQDLLRHKRSPMSTARKTAAMSALADMRGMQLDVLGWFLSMDKTHLYVLVR
ncbi:hypothetical protein ACW9HQ_38180, partial [Nocardia gipuzkoensis]